MISYNELIGLPVFVLNSNKKIAIVKDILFNCKKRILIGLVVEKKGIFSPPKYIPLDEIEKIESTFVMVRSKNSIKLIKHNDSLYRTATDTDSCSINTEVFSNNGQKIGIVNDIVFDFEFGTIDSYVISNGIIEDILSGRKVLIDDNIKIKRNKIFLTKNKFSK